MRLINFNAGPAGLPLPALERAQKELLDFEGTGMSIIEHSHRGKAYEKVHGECTALLRRLLKVPDTHVIFYAAGGASQQFATVPMNFLPVGRSADYVLTGVWSEKAIEEAKRVGTARSAWAEKTADGRFVRVPRREEIQLEAGAAYVHTTSNNTIYGTQFKELPDFGATPHVCDMSSDFLSRPFDVSKFAFVYAGAQKNIGPSGLVVCIARRDFVEGARKDIPKILRYQTHVEADSLYNTPNTFGIYLARNVLAWMEEQGGVEWIQQRNEKKGALLYGAIDARADFYRCPVQPQSRSLMNVVFRLPSEALEEKFVKEAQAKGMVGLKGHRSAGGIRASTYNAVSEADVAALVEFMTAFAKANG